MSGARTFQNADLTPVVSDTDVQFIERTGLVLGL